MMAADIKKGDTIRFERNYPYNQSTGRVITIFKTDNKYQYYVKLMITTNDTPKHCIVHQTDITEVNNKPFRIPTIPNELTITNTFTNGITAN